MAPRFSVLLPTHNRPEVLEHAIASVLAQSFADFELLVVGDGCTDTTAELVQGFDDHRIRWFDLPKAPGFGYANRNVALSEARGELVAYLGHDDLYFTDHLEQFDRLFRNPHMQFAHCLPVWIRDDGVLLPFFGNLRLPPARQRFLRFNNFLPSTTVVHRRGCLDEVGMWPADIEREGDYDLWKRILDHYSPRAVGYLRLPTCLHFRADWRDAEKWSPRWVAYLEAIHGSGRFWPAGLKLDFESSALPQAQAWKIIDDGGTAWLRRLREAVAMTRDMLAYHAALDPNFAL